MGLALREPGADLIGLLQKKIVQNPDALMDLDVFFEVAVNQLGEDGLNDLGVGVLKNNPNEVALFGRFDEQVFRDEQGSLIKLVSARTSLGQDFVGADQLRDLPGEVEAAQDFHFGINDVLAPRVGRSYLRVSRAGVE